MKRVFFIVLAVCLGVPLLGSGAAAAPAATLPGAASLQAGYLFPVGPRHTVYTQFRAPTISCGVQNASVTFGVGLANSGTGRSVRIEVDGDCRGGQLYYRAFYKESGGARRSHLGHRVTPGDLVEIDITGAGAGVEADITDETAGWSLGLSAVPGIVPDTGSVLARERRSPDAIRPLARFSTVRFNKTQVDYKPVSGPLLRVLMRSGGVLKAKPSQFQRQRGTFSVTWLHH